MRLTGLRSLLFGALALLVVGVLPSCQNPLDPLSKTDKIEGLSYVDFSSTWDRWDADPEYDGVVVTMSYFNEFGDTLSFHDKPHSLVIEMWTQKDTGSTSGTSTSFLSKDTLFFTKTIEFSNSDDPIRIPIEAYKNLIPSTAIDATTGGATGFMVVRVFPPQQFPRKFLEVAQPDVTFYSAPTAQDTPNP
jgi:hypothetical protein